MHYYHFEREGAAIFNYAVRCMVADEDEHPPEPPILQKIREAEDPHRALERFRPSNPQKGFIDIAVLLEEPPDDHPQDCRETHEDALTGSPTSRKGRKGTRPGRPGDSRRWIN
jgi:hypothetical protein